MLAKRLPAEWEPQSAVLLTWPHEHGDWGKDYAPVEKAFITIARAIASTQKVIIGAFDVHHQNDIMQKLRANQVDMTAVLIYLVPSNDVWARDHGPITIFEGIKAIQCDFKFNAWGAKYASDLDDQIPQQLFKASLLKGYHYQKIDFILEGGSIETDGDGTLLTTSLCLQNQQRNNQLSQSEIEQELQAHLGITRILWLTQGFLLGDDTDGHIDTLARFFNPNTIGYVHCDDKSDPHYEPLMAMYEQLKSFKDKSNQPYDLVPLPLPSPIFNKEDQRLPATYANFLITNTQVLVPLYEDKHDTHVLEIFKQYFPNRTIIGIDCRAVIEQYGSLHCLTMQIPKIPSE